MSEVLPPTKATLKKAMSERLEPLTREDFLEKLRIACLVPLSNEFINAAVEYAFVTDDFIKNQITMRLSGYLYSQTDTVITIKYPRDWWQAFKARWFPQYLLRYRPIIYSSHKVDAVGIYPNFKPYLPKETFILKLKETKSEG